MSGTRVVTSPTTSSMRLAERQRAWLQASRLPGPARYRELATTALLDIHTLLLDNGASVAGWPQLWRYVWPRDASMVAVALARTGHQDDAERILEFLQDVNDDGVFEARYRPDRSGPPDDRGEQSDSVGWVLWATATIARSLPASSRLAFLSRLRPLIDSCGSAALRLTDSPTALPPVSPDYWEVRTERLSLGTAAPMAFALDATADLAGWTGDLELVEKARTRAALLRGSITERFGGAGYPRYLGDDTPDAAVAFLLPPFATKAQPAVLEAWRRAADGMQRPAGGLAPGVGWKNDGISWTPQTALFALTAAATGDEATARARLDWIGAHRTEYGAIPEKVLFNGEPSGPAPLAWTCAMVLLALHALSGP
ncbi:MAG: glycoside hydrolase family 15 [Dermatophilaceae bacterium]